VLSYWHGQRHLDAGRIGKTTWVGP